jgi:hypothetical protein
MGRMCVAPVGVEEGLEVGLEDGHVILLQVLEALAHEPTALPGQRRALEAQALRLMLQACGDRGREEGRG